MRGAGVVTRRDTDMRSLRKKRVKKWRDEEIRRTGAMSYRRAAPYDTRAIYTKSYACVVWRIYNIVVTRCATCLRRGYEIICGVDSGDGYLRRCYVTKVGYAIERFMAAARVVVVYARVVR